MSAKIHFRPAEMLNELRPEDLGLRHTFVQRIEAPASIDTGENEVCLVLLAGKATYRIDGLEGVAEAKDMLYVPRRRRIALKPGENAVVMKYGAPAHIDTEFAHISFACIDAHPKLHARYGKAENNTRRDVWHFIDDDFRASRLMMGITRSETGGWTSWPPHEHGDQREEVYTYFDMGRSFGLQCVYDDLDRPQVALVRDGDLVSIPGGYHPNVGAPAGCMCFVYCMVAITPGRREFMNLRIQPIYGDKFE